MINEHLGVSQSGQTACFGSRKPVVQIHPPRPSPAGGTGRHAGPRNQCASVKVRVLRGAPSKTHNVELTGAARLYRAASSDRRERG